MIRNFLSVFSSAVLMVSIISATLSEAALAIPSKTKSKAWQPTIAYLNNQTYELETYHYGFLVRLLNGKSAVSEDHLLDARVSLCQSAIGDLNGDGLLDAVVELRYEPKQGDSAYVVKFMLNDGVRLFDAGTCDLGISGMVQSFRIENGTVLGKLQSSSHQKDGFSARLVDEPLMHARTFQVSESLSPLGDRQKYFRDFAAQTQKVWLEIKARSVKPPTSGAGKAPALSMKPVVISLNHTDVQLKASSGDPNYDSDAYQAIDCTRREIPVPGDFIDADPPMVCTFLKDTVTCKDLASFPETDIDTMRSEEKNTARPQGPVVLELLQAAKRFPVKPWYVILQNSNGNIRHISNLECAMTAAGDYNGDGQQDLVVLLRKQDKQSDGTFEIKNLVVPLIFDHGRLKELPQQFYCLETGSFNAQAADLISNIRVTRLNVTPNKIVIMYRGNRDNGSATAIKKFATEIDLMSHAVPIVRLNGKIFPSPDADPLMEGWMYIAKHHATIHHAAANHTPSN